MKNTNKLIGIIAIVAIIWLFFTACDNDNGGKTITFSLDIVDSRTFNVTVEGAKWLEDNTMSGMNVLLSGSLTVNRNSDGYEYTTPRFSEILELEITDYVAIFRLQDLFYGLKGTISFNTSELAKAEFRTTGGHSDVYQVNTSKSSITFPAPILNSGNIFANKQPSFNNK
jgi:hypothetical protein